MAAVASCGENKFKVCFIFFLQSSVLISRTHIMLLHCRPVLSTFSQQVDRGNALIVGKARLVKVRQDGRLNLKDRRAAASRAQRWLLAFRRSTQHSPSRAQAIGRRSSARLLPHVLQLSYKLLLVHVLRVLASAESEIIFHSFHCCPCIAA